MSNPKVNAMKSALADLTEQERAEVAAACLGISAATLFHALPTKQAEANRAAHDIEVRERALRQQETVYANVFEFQSLMGALQSYVERIAGIVSVPGTAPKTAALLSGFTEKVGGKVTRIVQHARACGLIDDADAAEFAQVGAQMVSAIGAAVDRLDNGEQMRHLLAEHSPNAVISRQMQQAQEQLSNIGRKVDPAYALIGKTATEQRVHGGAWSNTAKLVLAQLKTSSDPSAQAAMILIQKKGVKASRYVQHAAENWAKGRAAQKPVLNLPLPTCVE